MERGNTAPDQHPQRPDPEQGRSATRMGFFMVPVFFFGAVIMIGIGFTFLSIPDQPAVLGYAAFALAAVCVLLAIRRIRRISTGKEKY
ncbi:hypothetical protein [Enteractinococcus coprophilus]|uniref:Uncharacterized protein n=1 Tax=Enteractinococcus coprophilus TaxID=1027633 RepID=A0A543ANK7_9MICC|nr:hypothetical protein [Enteractinococcus coprophilus]TQL74162.1 hypothetical protein FB556_0615 [Enteractinococcus coprophilus]